MQYNVCMLGLDICAKEGRLKSFQLLTWKFLVACHVISGTESIFLHNTV